MDYTGLGIEAYTLTQKIIDKVNERISNRKRGSHFDYHITFKPIAHMRGGDLIQFTAWPNYVYTGDRYTPSKLTDFSTNEIKDAVLKFLNDVESVLREYVQQKI